MLKVDMLQYATATRTSSRYTIRPAHCGLVDSVTATKIYEDALRMNWLAWHWRGARRQPARECRTRELVWLLVGWRKITLDEI